MMRELDDLFAVLRDQPGHAGLAALDAPVMAGLVRRREAVVARRGMVLAGLVAIVVGAAGTMVPGTPAAAQPLLSIPAYAPSHLLAD